MRVSQSVLTVVLFALLSQQIAAAENAKGLQELIDKAPAGGEVTIPKGVWAEPLRIDKRLTLRGDDRDECVVDVVSDQPAIRFAHNKGQAALENVTVRWRRATSTNTADVQAAVAAKDGAVLLRNVRVVAPDDYARCPSAFTASGFGHVKIDGCEFEGYEFTLQFGGGAKATVTDCVVSNPGHCGITAGPESNVKVARTIITGSRYHGLRCTGGELTAENNLVIGNKNRGFYLGNKSARGTIRENVIQDNGSGISGFAQTDVKIHNNFIAGSEYAAIDMRDGCRLRVERNLLVNNGRGMVLFKELGTNRNAIGRNASAGNKTETEGFEPPPALEKVEGEVAEGEFAMEKAHGFGLTDPAKFRPLWERWTALRKRATTAPSSGG
jgi:parallel beta-helix repeat protein